MNQSTGVDAATDTVPPDNHRNELYTNCQPEGKEVFQVYQNGPDSGITFLKLNIIFVKFSSKTNLCTFSQLIMGPMFSGKTTELIRRLKRYQIARYECLIVKYADDVRYDDKGIATHDKQVLNRSNSYVRFYYVPNMFQSV